MRLFPALLCLLTLAACHSVRTVYDEHGNVVDDSPKNGESDLSDHFEKQFNDAFSEEKKNGVPTSTSNRVSSYQKQLDDAKRDTKEFGTKRYDGADSRSDLLSTTYGDADKSFESKRLDTSGKVAYDTTMRPDFMNETHGISSTQRNSADSADRLETQDKQLGEKAEVYATHASRYQTSDPNYYVEERRDKTPEPEITNFRDYYRKSIKSTRSLLGRDSENSAASASDSSDAQQ